MVPITAVMVDIMNIELLFELNVVVTHMAALAAVRLPQAAQPWRMSHIRALLGTLIIVKPKPPPLIEGLVTYANILLELLHIHRRACPRIQVGLEQVLAGIIIMLLALLIKQYTQI
jgi:hypothetical protein